MATRRFPEFEREVKRARDLVGIGQSLSSITNGLIGGDDHFRSALVHAVAALDSYVHGVVLDRAVDILMGRLKVAVSSKVGLSFSAIGQIMSAGPPGSAAIELAARTYVAERLGLETYQRPDDIASALAMVGIQKIWSTAFPGDAHTQKTALGVVVSRRNRIVHQCDLDPLPGGTTTPISSNDALDAITTIEHIVTKLDQTC
ncbi:hypothetical protein [Streptomyces sp. FL07-04A]|uniref:hypothetical protein n=1 Tax=Streptomyces sp. FL07-04A TaxID=3028658 RepID=UPI0029BBBAC5|nr:hypothetical protein [Streptomyces sp. FL07-04A]MDX3577472.1 hypothetical protein [Streptomyces sp. FL07-04A]